MAQTLLRLFSILCSLRPDLDRRAEAFFIQGQGTDTVGGGLGQAPAEEPFGFGRAHIDAAVAQRDAKIIVPVGAVEGVTLRGEERDLGHAG